MLIFLILFAIVLWVLNSLFCMVLCGLVFGGKLLAFVLAGAYSKNYEKGQWKSCCLKSSVL